MTDTKELIEAAAKACGMPYSRHDEMRGGAVIQEEGSGEWFIWNPLTSQGNNDDMGCDLMITVNFYDDSVEAWNDKDGIKMAVFEVQHDNTIKGRRAAVRLARTQVAAQMGRAK